MRRCQYCQYDLEALPTAHKCPECGVEYDEYSVVLRSSLSREYRQLIVAGILVLVMGWAAARYTGFRQDDLYLMGIILLSVLIALWKITTRSRSDGIVIVTRAGVDFRRSGFDAGLLNWQDLESADVQHVRRRFIIRGHDAKVLFACPVGRIGGRSLARTWASSINERKELYLRV